MTENTGQMDVGEGVLWRSKTEPTSFKITVADPGEWGSGVSGTPQSAGTRHAGGDTPESRSRPDHRDRTAARWRHRSTGYRVAHHPAAVLTEDVPVNQRVSREVMFRVANSYFDALEGDSGKIGAFADDCVRHENGYRTVNNPPPGGRMMPGPQLPDPEHGAGQVAARVQHAHVLAADRLEDLCLHETHSPAACADPRRAEADRRDVPALRARRDSSRCAGRRAAEHAAESGDDGDVLGERRPDSPRRGGAVRDASVRAGQWLDAGSGR